MISASYKTDQSFWESETPFSKHCSIFLFLWQWVFPSASQSHQSYLPKSLETPPIQYHILSSPNHPTIPGGCIWLILIISLSLPTINQTQKNDYPLISFRTCFFHKCHISGNYLNYYQGNDAHVPLFLTWRGTSHFFLPLHPIQLY